MVSEGQVGQQLTADVPGRHQHLRQLGGAPERWTRRTDDRNLSTRRQLLLIVLELPLDMVFWLSCNQLSFRLCSLYETHERQGGCTSSVSVDDNRTLRGSASGNCFSQLELDAGSGGRSRAGKCLHGHRHRLRAEPADLAGGLYLLRIAQLSLIF